MPASAASRGCEVAASVRVNVPGTGVVPPRSVPAAAVHWVRLTGGALAELRFQARCAFNL